jgi:hypothetical protein
VNHARLPRDADGRETTLTAVKSPAAVSEYIDVYRLMHFSYRN